MPETIEKPIANRPAPTWQPAPLRPPPHPTVAALKAEADAVREDAAATAARADTMTQAANAVAQRIDSLEREKTELVNWLAGIEASDLKTLRESARADVHRFFGRPNLDYNQRTTLNGACAALGWTKEVEKELPAMKRDLQNRLAEIEKSLADLNVESHAGN